MNNINMNLFALIVAGGKGNRMNSELPKQFMLLNNKPVLMHTIHRFIAYNPDIKINLVLPDNQFKTWNELCKKHTFKIEHHLVAGGDLRFDSVKNGLDTLPDEGIVFIHDGVRPLVSFETIDRCLNTAIKNGNAIPALPLHESIRKIDGESNMAVDRSHYVSIQTPQVFQLHEIKTAYGNSHSRLFTDDASVLEAMNRRIHLVKGNIENIKITYPGDLILAKSIQDNKA